MSQGTDASHSVDIGRLLAGAAKTVGSASLCWLATTAENGRVSLRPMGRIERDEGEDEWKIRFITDGRSHKADDMRRASTVSVIFQHEADLAFVALTGKAALHESAEEVRRRWKSGYDAYFPSETDRANAIFVEVDVERMELWIRGVTPEPFGLKTTRLERDAVGEWRATV